jgi:hypothetical protein
MLGSSENGLDEKLEESAVRHMAWVVITRYCTEVADVL